MNTIAERIKFAMKAKNKKQVDKLVQKHTGDESDPSSLQPNKPTRYIQRENVIPTQTRRKKKTRSILLNPVSYFSIRSDKFRHFPYRAFLSCFVSDIFDDTESGIRLAELR